MLSRRCSQVHSVADKRIEHFSESGENGFELFSNVHLLMCIESNRGHGGLLTNLTCIMCRRCHRNARWIGVESHRRDIRVPGGDDAALICSRSLYRAYERGQEVASISYVVIRIFGQ